MSQIVENTEIDEHLEEIAENLIEHLFYTISIATNNRTPGIFFRCIYSQTRLTTVKPVCSDHLYNKNHYLWFIQECVLRKTEGADLPLLAIPAFWNSSRWPRAT